MVMTPRNRRIAAVALAALPLSAVLHGCSSPTAPPTPPGGGQQIVLDYASFQSSVAPVLTSRGCDAGGDCHGAGIRGSLRLSPADAKDTQYDFDQVSLQVSSTTPEQSPILTEPLAIAAGGTPHGFKPFASIADSDYQAIRTWILEGIQP